MLGEFIQKVTSNHLRRNAYLYIRQSTLRQVFENTESTKRQYGLKERAMSLGWAIEKIIVIDSDLGRSGASSSEREGFKRLVSEVGMGNAGIVIGLEVSRLARNSSDWHRLLEICALTQTLILDEDGIYNPCLFNDRLLLGLKGTMSEAELHVIKARLIGGILAKAKRGELITPIPVGFIYDKSGKVILDPDKQVQNTIRLLFKIFRREGSATATVKYFNRNNIKFPKKLQLRKKLGDEEVLWVPLEHSKCLQILHNPRYTGAFFFGRKVIRKLADGTKKYENIPQEKWHSLLKDNHEGYISWEEYEENCRRLNENFQLRCKDRKNSPPREGPALLQGLVICGICGGGMTVRYHTRKGKRVPDYMCQKEGIKRGEKICQHIPGGEIDKAIGNLLINTMNPLALEVALKVQDELQSRIEESDKIRKQQVERSRYEAELARRRYMQVDPDNRLVAGTLEGEWNNKLKELEESQKEYERQCEKDRKILSTKQKNKIMSLATDFKKLWSDLQTQDRDRKRMVRLLIEDVTILKKGKITLNIRFKGGAVRTMLLPAPQMVWEQHTTSPRVVSLIDQLLNDHTDKEIAVILNNKKETSGKGCVFNERMVSNIRRKYKIKCRFDRLRSKNLLTIKEISHILQISGSTVKNWARKNMIKSYKLNEKRECLYERPTGNLVEDLKNRDVKNSKYFIKNKKFFKKLAERIKEVQYEV